MITTNLTLYIGDLERLKVTIGLGTSPSMLEFDVNHFAYKLIGIDSKRNKRVRPLMVEMHQRIKDLMNSSKFTSGTFLHLLNEFIADLENNEREYQKSKGWDKLPMSKK